jgi:CheY-like chemotaxis protein
MNADHRGAGPTTDQQTVEPRASILIVDDHPANLVALEAILSPLGHELVMARSGEEALRHILHGEFALILLDVQMADMNGFETAGLIKQHPRSRHIPIIFITAVNRDAIHVFRGYSQGAVDYLVKPFDADILRSKAAVFIELYVRGEKIKQQERLLHQLRRIGSDLLAIDVNAPLLAFERRPAGLQLLANDFYATGIGVGNFAPLGHFVPMVFLETRLGFDRNRPAFVHAQAPLGNI